MDYYGLFQMCLTFHVFSNNLSGCLVPSPHSYTVHVRSKLIDYAQLICNLVITKRCTLSTTNLMKTVNRSFRKVKE